LAKQSQTQQFTVSASQNSLSDSLGTSVSSDGNDSYLVHNTYDQVSQALNGSTWYTIYADVENYVLPANVEALFLMNSVVRGTGNSAANAIYGSDTSNTIDGGGGGDTLIGGDGNDTHHRPARLGRPVGNQAGVGSAAWPAADFTATWRDVNFYFSQ
jgi:hypothetical protein